MQITVTRLHNGAWEVSAVVGTGRDAYRACRVFYGYTKREAVREFRTEFSPVYTRA